MDLSKLLIEHSLREGFALAGVIDIDLALEDPHGLFSKHVQRYHDWINQGYAGSMEYLVRGREKRANPRLLFEEAESLLCVAIPYPRGAAGAQNPQTGPRYARYLQGEDYHITLSEKLERVMQHVAASWTPQNQASSPLRWKVCVDTSAVLERSWAALSGLGWIGKNSLLIHPQHGSYLFLAEVLINQKTGQGPKPLPSYCGNCTRCLRACPPQALLEPGVLDSNRCTSFWTLEKRGELPLTEHQKNSLSCWIAGCDICQEVCPFNIKPTHKELQTKLNSPLSPTHHATQLQDWLELLQETPEQYKIRVKNSALNRVKPAQFRRNLALTLRNSLSLISDSDSTPWEWLMKLRPLIHQKLQDESDEATKKEWIHCWNKLEEKLRDQI
jgi:epoxyqueuosine reductase